MKHAKYKDLVRRLRGVETGREGHLAPKSWEKEAADYIDELLIINAELQKTIELYADDDPDRYGFKGAIP